MVEQKTNGQEKTERQYTLNEAMDLLTKQAMNSDYSMPSRSRLASTFMDPRRSINDECGYKRTEELSIEDYKNFYDREPVATRVVEIMPSECWKIQPTVYESEDSDEVTEFEEAWDALGRSLAGAGFFRSEQGSPIWDHLRKADILSGIGHYGGILLGIDDGKPMSEPAEGIDEHGQPSKKSVAERKLLYLRPLDESCLQITGWNEDSSSPRYNKPTEYSVTTARQLSQGLASISPGDMQTLKVHWSRVVHLADGGDVFATPRMRPVFNRLYDIYKVCGSSGEMYYKGAFPGWGLEMLPELILAGHIKDVDTTGVKDEIENWQNGLQRVLFLKGLTMKNLGSQVVDPTSAVLLYVKMICIQLGIPERIFMGSERGELASSQDKSAWDKRIMGRQQTYLTPKEIVPFVDRLILLGILPRPEEYYVKWPDLGALTDAEKATIAVQRIDAMVKYVQGGVGDAGIMQPMDLLTRELGYEDEEAQEILEASSQVADERMDGEGSGESPLLSMVGGITGITELFKAAKEGSISPDQLKQTLMMFYKLPEEKADEMVAGMQEQIDAEAAKQEEQAAQQAKDMKAAGVQPGQQPIPGQPPRQPQKPNPFQKGQKPNPFQKTQNVFCATGGGGGVDPSCGKGGSAESMSHEDLVAGIKAIPVAERQGSPLWKEYERRRGGQMGGIAKKGPTLDDAKSLGGFEKGLSPASRAKAVEQMNEQHIISGKPQTRKQYVEDSVAGGATVGIKEKQRAIVHPNGSYMRQKDITKTAVDYAEYLIAKRQF